MLLTAGTPAAAPRAHARSAARRADRQPAVGAPGGLVVVNFHYVRPRFDSEHGGIHGCTPAMLESQLRELGRMGEFVGLEEVRAAATGGGSLPARALLVTFDDGLREQWEHALPVLDRLGVPAAFFVNTAPILERRVLTVHRLHLLRERVAPAMLAELLAVAALEAGIRMDAPVDEASAARQYRYDAPEVARLKFLLNVAMPPSERDALVDRCFHRAVAADDAALAESLYMDVGQLRELAGRGWLGSHGHAHLALGRVRRSEARADLARARALLERWTGVAPAAVSYPYGSDAACGGREAPMLAAATGHEIGFTMQRAVNAGFVDRWSIARFDSNDAPGGRHAIARASRFMSTAPRAGEVTS